MSRARRTAAVVLACAGIATATVATAGCGGADGTPASTREDGTNVYDPDHNVINLAPGPRFVIQMPEPEEGQEWQLHSEADVGGVSLKGMERPDGGGAWLFDTIGAGAGVLQFRQAPPETEDFTESVDYEVNIK